MWTLPSSDCSTVLHVLEKIEMVGAIILRVGPETCTMSFKCLYCQQLTETFISLETATTASPARPPRSACAPTHDTTAAPWCHTSSAATRSNVRAACLVQPVRSTSASTNVDEARGQRYMNCACL